MVRFEWRGRVEGEVISVQPKRSPLVQGGLKIPILVSVTWANARALGILKQKTEEVSYSIEDEYHDDSNELLTELCKENPDSDEEPPDYEAEEDTDED